MLTEHETLSGSKALEVKLNNDRNLSGVWGWGRSIGFAQ